MRSRRSKIVFSTIVGLLLLIVGLFFVMKPTAHSEDIDILGIQGTQNIKLVNKSSHFDCDFTEEKATLKNSEATPIECTIKKKWLSIFNLKQTISVKPNKLIEIMTFEELIKNQEVKASVYDQFYEIINDQFKFKLSRLQLESILIHPEENDTILFYVFFKLNDDVAIIFIADSIVVTRDGQIMNFPNNEKPIEFNYITFDSNQMRTTIDGYIDELNYIELVDDFFNTIEGGE